MVLRYSHCFGHVCNRDNKRTREEENNVVSEADRIGRREVLINKQ